MKLYVFDDAVADGWEPFSLTRPCAQLLYGTLLLRERLERFAGTRAAGLVSRPWLSSYREDGSPPWTAPDAIDPGEPRLLLSSRAVPGEGASFAGSETGGGPVTLRIGTRTVGAWLPAGVDTPGADWLADPGALEGAEAREIPGEVLGPVWELVAGNPERLAADLAADVAGAGRREGAAARVTPARDLPAGVWLLGEGPVLLGPEVRIERGVTLDARDGPIRLDGGVEVRTGTRLTGPLHAGAHSRLLGGSLSVLSAGPYSYLRGEVEETVVLGYSNKAHDGFLGHAYLGRWVNLGAMTTNSDLKNNYGTIRMGPPGEERDTGLLKLGCFLGDHAKTGIGVLLDTGTVVGAGSNLFGTEMPPKWVPAFSWGRGAELVEYRRDAFLDTARTVLGRRGVAFDEETREWLRAAWEAGRGGVREGGRPGVGRRMTDAARGRRA